MNGALRRLAGLATALATGATLIIIAPTVTSAAEPDPQMSSRVVGGFNAPRSTTRFFLQMELRGHPQGGTLCGATAINSRWAVTAAHCVKPTHRKIAVGPGQSAVLVNPKSRSQGKRYYLRRLVVHPGWRPNSDLQLHDIALIQTLKPMPVQRLRVNRRNDWPTLGTKESVYGFGLLDYDQPGSAARYLQQVNVEDLAGMTDVCGEYGNAFRGRHQICAGLESGGKDACNGDSGGPLVAVDRGVARLVGVVSTGIDCGHEDYPGIYTRVSPYASWISMWSSGSVHVSSACSGPCGLRRSQSASVRLRNLEPEARRYRVVGQRRHFANPRQVGTLRPGQRRTITMRVRSRAQACARIAVKAQGTPIRRIRVGLNGLVC